VLLLLPPPQQLRLLLWRQAGCRSHAPRTRSQCDSHHVGCHSACGCFKASAVPCVVLRDTAAPLRESDAEIRGKYGSCLSLAETAAAANGAFHQTAPPPWERTACPNTHPQRDSYDDGGHDGRPVAGDRHVCAAVRNCRAPCKCCHGHVEAGHAMPQPDHTPQQPSPVEVPVQRMR
jgi:hypothetical protein